jgi:hypothetical protein
LSCKNQKNLPMKHWIRNLAAITGFALAATVSRGTEYTFNSTNSVTVPDFPSSGVAYQFLYDHPEENQITAVTVTFTTLGGWNGDLYAYLSHGDGLAILLNRVGASLGNPDGYSTSGFNTITLSSLATMDIHTVETPTTEDGPFAADGRLTYTDTDRFHKLDVFDADDPIGTWTLFFDDTAPLNTVILDSWSVGIMTIAVPEPGTLALGCLGAAFVLIRVRRSQGARRLIHSLKSKA